MLSANERQILHQLTRIADALERAYPKRSTEQCQDSARIGKNLTARCKLSAGHGGPHRRYGLTWKDGEMPFMDRTDRSTQHHDHAHFLESNSPTHYVDGCAIPRITALVPHYATWENGTKTTPCTCELTQDHPIEQTSVSFQEPTAREQCPLTTTDGTRCVLLAGHSGNHYRVGPSTYAQDIAQIREQESELLRQNADMEECDDPDCPYAHNDGPHTHPVEPEQVSANTEAVQLVMDLIAAHRERGDKPYVWNGGRWALVPEGETPGETVLWTTLEPEEVAKDERDGAYALDAESPSHTQEVHGIPRRVKDNDSTQENKSGTGPQDSPESASTGRTEPPKAQCGASHFQVAQGEPCVLDKGHDGNHISFVHGRSYAWGDRLNG